MLKKFNKNLSEGLNTLKILWKVEHLLQKSKCSIFHNFFKYIIFQRCQKALLWGKGLIMIVLTLSLLATNFVVG